MNQGITKHIIDDKMSLSIIIIHGNTTSIHINEIVLTYCHMSSRFSWIILAFCINTAHRNTAFTYQKVGDHNVIQVEI